MVFLFHQRRVLEVFFTLQSSLDARVINSTDFFRVEFLPLFSVEGLEKVFQIFQREEVYECVAHVAVVVEVDWKVKEIVLVLEFSVYRFQHLFFRVLVRDVPDHQGLPGFFLQATQIHLEFFVVFYFVLFSLLLFLVGVFQARRFLRRQKRRWVLGLAEFVVVVLYVLED